MLERLQEVERRYEELLRLIGDRREFAKLTRERAQLEEIVACLRERERVARDVAEHREVLGGADAELRELARSELPALEARLAARDAERRGWRVVVLSSSATGLGGLKEVIALVQGKGAFSRLKFEGGVHRVQ